MLFCFDILLENVTPFKLTNTQHLKVYMVPRLGFDSG